MYPVRVATLTYALQIQDDQGRVLLSVGPDGSVVCPSVEAATEAGERLAAFANAYVAGIYGREWFAQLAEAQGYEDNDEFAAGHAAAIEKVAAAIRGAPNPDVAWPA